MLINIAITVMAVVLCLALGYGINTLVGGLPPSLYGMVLFALALQLKWVNAPRVASTVDWAIKHMGVCFVPAGVGIMNHEQLIREHGFTMIALVCTTTFLLLTFVGKAYQLIEDRHTNKTSNSHD